MRGIEEKQVYMRNERKEKVMAHYHGRSPRGVSKRRAPPCINNFSMMDSYKIKMAKRGGIYFENKIEK